jgi:hypothetical protein
VHKSSTRCHHVAGDMGRWGNHCDCGRECDAGFYGPRSICDGCSNERECLENLCGLCAEAAAKDFEDCEDCGKHMCDECAEDWQECNRCEKRSCCLEVSECEVCLLM